MRLYRFLVPAALVLCVAVLQVANGATYGFKNITANNLADAAIGEVQLTMEVSNAGNGQVLFKFVNSGPAASSICDVYFDDGALLGMAVPPFSYSDPTKVSFSVKAHPWNLPGHEDFNFRPEYDGTKNVSFAADSDSPTQPMGVNPGEWLGILFNLQAGRTYADVLASLALAQTDIRHDLEGGLRVGIHVQGFDSGGSESFINVPDGGTTLALLGIALAGFGLIRRKLS